MRLLSMEGTEKDSLNLVPLVEFDNLREGIHDTNMDVIHEICNGLVAGTVFPVFKRPTDISLELLVEPVSDDPVEINTERSWLRRASRWLRGVRGTLHDSSSPLLPGGEIFK